MKSFLKITALLIVIAVAVSVIYSLFPLAYADEIRAASAKYNIDKYVLCALIKAESDFDASAVSNKGAKGLMQLTDETAADCAKKLGITYDVFKPADNIALGSYYFAALLENYNGNLECAIAAYNAGHGNVDKWLADKKYSADSITLDTVPFEETRLHITKVLRYCTIYRYIYPNL